MTTLRENADTAFLDGDFRLAETRFDPIAADASVTAVDRATAQLRVGQCRRERARFDDARMALDAALSMHEAAFGHEHVALCEVLDELALLAIAMDQPDDARPFLERVEAIRTKALDPTHVDHAGSFIVRAEWLWAVDREEEALPLYEQAVARREAAFGEKHRLVAQALNLLAVAHASLGDDDIAAALYRRAVDIGREVLPARHPWLAQLMFNLAEGAPSYSDDQNVTLLERATEIWRERFGVDDPRTMRAIDELASVLSAQGRVSEALDLVARTLAELPIAVAGRKTLESQHARLEARANDSDRARSNAWFSGNSLRRLDPVKGVPPAPGITVASAASLSCIARFTATDVQAVALSADRTHLAVIVTGGISLIELGTLAVRGFAPSNGMYSGAFVGDNVTFAVGSDGDARVWRLDRGDYVRTIGTSYSGSILATSHRGDRLVIGGSPVVIARTADGTRCAEFECPDGPRALFTRDDAWLACAPDGDNGVTIRSSDDGTEIRRIALPMSARSIELCRDGTLLVADGSLIKWIDPATGETRREWSATQAHGGESPRTATQSPDGSLLATWGHDGNLVLWEVDAGRVIATIANVSAGRFLAFSGDGARLVTLGSDGSLCLWGLDAAVLPRAIEPWRERLPNGAIARLIGEETCHSGSVTALGALARTHIVSASLDGTLCIWDERTERVVVRAAVRNDADITSIAHSSDERVVVARGAWGAEAFDLASETRVETPSDLIEFGAPQTTIISPDRTKTAESDNERIVIRDSKQSNARIEIRASARVRALAFDRQSHFLIAATDDALCAWRTDGTLIAETHTPGIRVLAASLIADKVATGSDSGDIAFWNVPGLSRRVPPLNWQQACFSLAVSRDGTHLAAGNHAAGVDVWDIASGQRVASCSAHERARDDRPVYALEFEPDGRSLIAAIDGRGALLRFDLESRAIEDLSADPGRFGAVTSLAFAPDRGHFAAGTRGGGLYVVDWKTLRVTSAAHLVRSEVCVAYSSDGTLLASTADGSVYLRDPHTAAIRARLDDHLDGVFAVAFSPDGTLLASAGVDRVVCLWDVATRRLVARLNDHRDVIRSVAFSPDGTLLASAGGMLASDSEIRIWHVASGRVLARLSGHRWGVSAVRFAANGNLYSAGHGGGIVAWNDRWIRPDEVRTELAPRTRTRRLHDRDRVWSLWVSAKSFDERALGLPQWTHDREESGLPEPVRFSPSFMERFERAARMAGAGEIRVGFKLAGLVWDVDPGPMPDHPEVFYLGAIAEDD